MSMEAKALARQVRVSPIKVRRVLELIRGKQVGDALMALRYCPQKPARLVGKVLQSATGEQVEHAEEGSCLFGEKGRQCLAVDPWSRYLYTYPVNRQHDQRKEYTSA